ncbi:MAG: hypothetical protein P4N60_22110 [Verrucomicrobiae bacterium]|nr:hypothetical protein [Verrucomicrobiae bacterium]
MKPGITNPVAPQIFTAAAIAAALGIKRQSVQWHLRDVGPVGVQIVAGNEAAAWTVEQLPILDAMPPTARPSVRTSPKAAQMPAHCIYTKQPWNAH